MTIICVRDGVMAADSMSVLGGHLRSTVVAGGAKITRLRRHTWEGSLVGCAGYTAIIHQFLQWAEGNLDQRPVDIPADEFDILMLKPDGSLWRWDEKLRCYPLVDDFYAIGRPWEFAMGCMAAGCSAQQAVELSIKHSCSAGGAVQVEHL